MGNSINIVLNDPILEFLRIGLFRPPAEALKSWLILELASIRGRPLFE